jgi:MauM/NapG family ferredoxin protein
MAEEKKRGLKINAWRRLAQGLFLALFLFLFRKTDYGGQDQIGYAVNIFFRWDPLAAAAAMLAARTFISLLLPAVIVATLTILLGRFFCGWVCPLGTCLDLTHKIIPPRSHGKSRRYRNYKYFILFFVLGAAALGAPLVGYLDPFSILVRGLTLAVDPALNKAVTTPFDLAYRHGPDWLTAMSEPVYSFLRDTALPYKQKAFLLALPSLLILLAVFGLERIERRFWCRNLCPLGAMLALFSRLARLRLYPGKACKQKGCTSCIDICRTGAIDDDGLVSPESCILCLDCMAECPTGIISFKFKKPKSAPAPVSLSRRGAIGSLAAGLFLPAFLKARGTGLKPAPSLIRPPGAREESEFLSRCVRCGECMKVCIGNALHPALLEAGVEGTFSPILVPRIGCCEFNCTLCGQVCPTGAIQKLKREVKQKTVIGRAYFDHDRCLPWAKGVPCLVCEEMCPVPEKAIRLREEKVINYRGEEVVIKRPYLVDELCIGCGECENKCPLSGAAAVIVTSEGESRNPDTVTPYTETG